MVKELLGFFETVNQSISGCVPEYISLYRAVPQSISVDIRLCPREREKEN